MEDIEEKNAIGKWSGRTVVQAAPTEDDGVVARSRLFAIGSKTHGSDVVRIIDRCFQSQQRYIVILHTQRPNQ